MNCWGCVLESSKVYMEFHINPFNLAVDCFSSIQDNGWKSPLQLNPFTPADRFRLIQNNEWKSPLKLVSVERVNVDEELSFLVLLLYNAIGIMKAKLQCFVNHRHNKYKFKAK